LVEAPVNKPVLKKILIALTLAALCLGLATCEKSCDLFGGNTKPADSRKPTVNTKPVAPVSKWVGRWVGSSGNPSYVIESEKNGSLYGYIPRGSGKEKVVMSVVNATTASYVTPVGVRVTFRLSGGNQLTVTSMGIGAKALRIVK
jgi:hypothetical protein